MFAAVNSQNSASVMMHSRSTHLHYKHALAVQACTCSNNGSLVLLRSKLTTALSLEPEMEHGIEERPGISKS